MEKVLEVQQQVKNNAGDMQDYLFFEMRGSNPDIILLPWLLLV